MLKWFCSLFVSVLYNYFTLYTLCFTLLNVCVNRDLRISIQNIYNLKNSCSPVGFGLYN